MDMEFNSENLIPINEIEPGELFRGHNGIFLAVTGRDKYEDDCRFYGAINVAHGTLTYFSQNAKFAIVKHKLIIED